jgi:Flagellar hook-length control protein FliK
MKISSYSATNTDWKNEAQPAGEKRPGRFSQLMKPGNRSDRKDAQKEPKPDKDGKDKAPSENAPAAVPNVDMYPPSPPTTNLEFATEKANSAKEVATDPYIEKLIAELQSQIDVVKVDGKTQGINITFDSKALEGLQVQIRQQEGELSIRFVTQSPNLSKLISRHTDSLRESLDSRGTRVRNISISSAAGRIGLQGNHYAGT